MHGRGRSGVCSSKAGWTGRPLGASLGCVMSHGRVESCIPAILRNGSRRAHWSERPWGLFQCGCLWGRCGSVACRGVGHIGSRRRTSASRRVGSCRIGILWVVILLWARGACLPTRSPVSFPVSVLSVCNPRRTVRVVVSRRIATVEIVMIIGRVHGSRCITRSWGVTLVWLRIGAICQVAIRITGGITIIIDIWRRSRSGVGGGHP